MNTFIKNIEMLEKMHNEIGKILYEMYCSDCEIWKEIEGYEGRYSVSNFGRVRNNKKKYIMKGSVTKTGYTVVKLVINDTNIKAYSIHKLVALYFLPKKYKKLNIRHVDNNKCNNNIKNLCWACDKGITYMKKNRKWYSYITHHGKNCHIGCYTKKEDAIKAREDKIKELFGEYV